MAVETQKFRINATLTEQAYQVLTRNATPRSIGKFLSELLTQFGDKTTLNHRMAILEAKVERVEALIDPQFKATDEDWIIAEQHSQEMAEGNYLTQEQFNAMLKEQGLAT